MFDIIVAMRINVLALNGVFDLGLAAILDAFQTGLSEMSGLAVPRFGGPEFPPVIAMRPGASYQQFAHGSSFSPRCPCRIAK